MDEHKPTWQVIVDLFQKHGLDAPPVRLRDELVMMTRPAPAQDAHDVARLRASVSELLEYAHWAVTVGGVCPPHLVGCRDRAKAALASPTTREGE